MTNGNGHKSLMDSLKWIVPSLGVIVMFGWNLAIDRGDAEIARLTAACSGELERVHEDHQQDLSRYEERLENVKLMYLAQVHDLMIEVNHLRAMIVRTAVRDMAEGVGLEFGDE